MLSRVLCAGNDIYAVFAGRKHQPAKVRLFIEHLKAVYGEKPYWRNRPLGPAWAWPLPLNGGRPESGGMRHCLIGLHLHLP